MDKYLIKFPFFILFGIILIFSSSNNVLAAKSSDVVTWNPIIRDGWTNIPYRGEAAMAFTHEYTTGSVFHFGTSNSTYIGLNGPFYGSGSVAAVSYIRNGTNEEIVQLGHHSCSGWCPVYDMVYHKASTTTTTVSKSNLSVKGTHTLLLDQRFNPSTTTASITFSY